MVTKKNHQKNNKDSDKLYGISHKGTLCNMPSCIVRLVMQPVSDQSKVDFIYDAGTELWGVNDMGILKNVAEEDALIETVTGEMSVSIRYHIW